MVSRRGRIHLQLPDNPYPIEMIQQAMPALEMLNLFGGLTSWQVCKLLFLNRPNSQGRIRSDGAARKATNQYCLRRLKDLGLVAVKAIAIPDRVPAKWEINFLTPQGYEALTQNRRARDLDTPPYRLPTSLTHQTINHHSMAIRDVGISALVGAWANHMQVGLYLDDWQVRSLAKQGQLEWPMEPDAVLALHYGQVRRAFFIEVDRGTESGRSNKSNSWQSKLERYQRYFVSHHTRDAWLGDYPPPNLMVVAPSERRLANLMEVTTEIGGTDGYWFSLSDYLEPPYSFFGEVWQRLDRAGYWSPAERFSS